MPPLVEPTSGNTGIGLALIAAVKGYRLILTMPDTISKERSSLLSAYGAHLILTPDTKGMGGAIHKAEELLQEHSEYFMPQQFNNPANPDMHRKTTAVELLKQFKRIDLRSGSRHRRYDYRRRRGSQRQDEKCSCLRRGAGCFAGNFRRALAITRFRGLAQAIATVLNRDILDEVIPVSDEDAAICARRLAAQEGLLVGISSGAACCATSSCKSLGQR